jgi:hypothetical protein
MMEQLLMWSAMTWSERNIYLEYCINSNFEELKSLRKGLYDANKINGIWDSYLKQIDEEILKKLPEIREDKINEILK